MLYQSLKQQGYQAETLVKNHYLAQGLTLREQNWTIPGGELDLVFESSTELIFIEVKSIDHTLDLDQYIGKKKLKTLERSIENYLMNHPSSKDIRLDVAFVQQGNILEIYENITNT